MKILNIILFFLVVNFAWGQIVCNQNQNNDNVIDAVRPPIDGVYAKIHIRTHIGSEDDNTDWSSSPIGRNRGVFTLNFGVVFFIFLPLAVKSFQNWDFYLFKALKF